MAEVLVDLSHPFGAGSPLWPYFEDVVIERKHYHAKSGVLSQKVTTVMHCTTHADSPACFALSEPLHVPRMRVVTLRRAPCALARWMPAAPMPATARRPAE